LVIRDEVGVSIGGDELAAEFALEGAGAAVDGAGCAAGPDAAAGAALPNPEMVPPAVVGAEVARVGGELWVGMGADIVVMAVVETASASLGASGFSFLSATFRLVATPAADGWDADAVKPAVAGCSGAVSGSGVSSADVGAAGGS
jgi:hypothetical protein